MTNNKNNNDNNNKNTQLHKIDEKAQFVEVYHTISVSGEAFSLISPNIPKSFLEVIQHIHGRYDAALYHVYKASNSTDNQEKLNNIHLASDELFFQYTSLEYLVKTKALSIGAANQVIDSLSDSYAQLKKWLSYIQKKIQEDGAGKTFN